MKTAIVTGVSGMVGSALLKQLIAHSEFEKIISVVRKPSGLVSDKLKEIVILIAERLPFWQSFFEIPFEMAEGRRRLDISTRFGATE